MRIFKTRDFDKFARKQKVEDNKLCDAIERAQKGSIDAVLNKSVIKQRVSRQDQGKRGGFRVLIAFRLNKRAVFIHGFPKNAKGNVSQNELKEITALANAFLGYGKERIEQLLKAGGLDRGRVR